MIKKYKERAREASSVCQDNNSNSENIIRIQKTGPYQNQIRGKDQNIAVYKNVTVNGEDPKRLMRP